MTISSTANRLSYAGNGVTVAFATSPVVFFDSADLTVYSVVTATGVSTLKTLTTDYTVTGGSGSTGTVTMLVAPATGTTLVIVRDVAATQGADLVNNDASDAEVLEDALDRLTMIAQQLDSRLDRTFHVSDSDVTGIELEVPDATTRALTVIGFDADGDIEFYDPASAVTADENVAVLSPGTGAVATTQGEVNARTLCVFDFMTAAQIADVKARTLLIDTSAARQAAHDAAYLTGRSVEYPAGSYRSNSTVTVGLDQRIYGEGMSNAGLKGTTIVPTGAGIHGFKEYGSGLYNRGTISDLNIVGGATTGSGFYSTTRLNYFLAFRNVFIDVGGDAVHMDHEFQSLFDNVIVCSTTGHGFYLEGDNSTVLSNCYAQEIRTAGKAGYRILGAATLVGCNGLNTTASGSSIWGLFGATVANDGFNHAYHVKIIGGNIEAYTDTGIRLIYAGYCSINGRAVNAVAHNSTIDIQTATSQTVIDGLDTSGISGSKTKLAEVYTAAANYNITARNYDPSVTPLQVDEAGTLRTIAHFSSVYSAWTPTLAGESTAGTNTYSSQVGWYRVDGRMVTAGFSVVLTGNSVAMVGNLIVKGLPFTAYASLAFTGGGSVVAFNNITLAANYTQLGLEVMTGTTYARIHRSGNNVAVANIAIGDINATSGYIQGIVQYQI